MPPVFLRSEFAKGTRNSSACGGVFGCGVYAHLKSQFHPTAIEQFEPCSLCLQADGLKKVLEKEERANFYRGTAESNNMSVIDSGEKAEGSPHRSPLRSPQCSTDNLEQLAKDIDSCPTCSPKKTKPPLDLSKSGDATPSIVVDAAKTTDPRSEDTTVDDVDFRKPVSGLLPSLEENCLSRDISQATSLETGQVSLLPHQGSTQNSDISDSWENLEELDLQVLTRFYFDPVKVDAMKCSGLSC